MMNLQHNINKQIKTKIEDYAHLSFLWQHMDVNHSQRRRSRLVSINDAVQMTHTHTKRDIKQDINTK